MTRLHLLGVALLYAIPSMAWADTPSLPPVLTLDASAVGNEGITTTAVTTGALAPVLSVMARVMPDTSRVVHIHPAGYGKVLAVLVQPGQRVRKGAALLRYQDHALHSARLQATQTQAALKAALATRSEAAGAVQRARQLLGQTIPLAELHRREATLAQAQAQVEARQAESGTLTHRFAEEFNSPSEQDGQDETSTLISPVDGVVQALDTALAADLTPAMDVATVADLSTVWIVADIPPDQAAHLQPGGEQKTHTAQGPVVSHIDTVDAAANPLTGLVRVISRVPNPTGQLIPGMVLDADVQEQDATPGLLVPSEAIQTLNGQDIVFIRQSATQYRPVPVRVGVDTGDRAVVHGALKDGDQVVGHGSFALKSMIGLAGLDAD